MSDILSTNEIKLRKDGDEWRITILRCPYCGKPAQTDPFAESRLRNCMRLKIWLHYLGCACQAWTEMKIIALPDSFSDNADLIIETFLPAESM